MSGTTLRMLRTSHGAEDGLTVLVFEEGRVYDVGPVLTRSFLAERWAEPAVPDGGVSEPRPCTEADVVAALRRAW
jgi:hypothetical protein